MELRSKILDAVTHHWHVRTDHKGAHCYCKQIAPDINEHITNEVLGAISATTLTAQWQYAEQLNNGTYLPFAEHDTTAAVVATHRRQVLTAQAWEKI